MNAPPQSGHPPISDKLREQRKYLPRSVWPQEAIDWQEAWLRENRAAIESSNVWLREHGLPRAKYRMF
jgi:hypothetical protein